MAKSINEYKSPAHKVVSFLGEGLEQLRSKYTELRKNFRSTQDQVRAVTKSRDAWRVRAEAAEAQLNSLKKVRPR